jgi:hypothetical protein
MTASHVDEEGEVETTMAPKGAIVVLTAWIAALQTA